MSDTNPCVTAGRHQNTQRHALNDCPAKGETTCQAKHPFHGPDCYGDQQQIPDPRWRHVRDLFVGCSLRTKNLNQPGFALSDTCQVHATSVVVMENGDRMYRCDAHEGIRRIERGPVEPNVRINAPR